MRVLLIGYYPPPVGGVATHVRQLHRSLQEQNVDVRVLNIGQGKVHGEGVVSARPGPQMIRQIFAEVKPGTVIHLHTSGNNRRSWMVAGMVGGAAATLRCPTVITVHSGLSAPFLSQSLIDRRLAAGALRLFTRIIAVSEPV